MGWYVVGLIPIVAQSCNKMQHTLTIWSSAEHITKASFHESLLLTIQHHYRISIPDSESKLKMIELFPCRALIPLPKEHALLPQSDTCHILNGSYYYSINPIKVDTYHIKEEIQSNPITSLVELNNMSNMINNKPYQYQNLTNKTYNFQGWILFLS